MPSTRIWLEDDDVLEMLEDVDPPKISEHIVQNFNETQKNDLLRLLAEGEAEVYTWHDNAERLLRDLQFLAPIQPGRRVTVGWIEFVHSAIQRAREIVTDIDISRKEASPNPLPIIKTGNNPGDVLP